MFEIEENAFEREVLAASAEVPVVVDFWAPWCGPCRALGPLLERLEESYAGRFKLVKVKCDASPELSARYGVRSIPYVIAFVGGQPLDSFVGALPEGQVRVFLDHVIPGPAELERLKSLRLLREGRLDDAATALRAAIALDPTNVRARLDLAELLIERMPLPVDPARLAEAESELAAVRSNARSDPRWRGRSIRGYRACARPLPSRRATSCESAWQTIPAISMRGSSSPSTTSHSVSSSLLSSSSSRSLRGIARLATARRGA